MTAETPSLNVCNYTSNTSRIGDIQDLGVTTASWSPHYGYKKDFIKEYGRQLDPGRGAIDYSKLLNQLIVEQKVEPKKEEKKVAASTCRIVRVFIVDTTEVLPLDKRIIYASDEKLTEFNDTELFFEVDFKPLLDKHNEMRKTVVNKIESQKREKDVYLEPIRIKDLTMTVVEVAKF